MANALAQAYLDLRTSEKLRAARCGHRVAARRNRPARDQPQDLRADHRGLPAQSWAGARAGGADRLRAPDRAQPAARERRSRHGDGGRTGSARPGARAAIRATRSTAAASPTSSSSWRRSKARSRRCPPSYGPAYPGLSSLEEQRTTFRQKLGMETGRVTSVIGHDYKAAASRVASLRQQVEALKKEVTIGDDATTQIATLQRDADVERELYLDLTKRVNELEAERRLVVGDARLVNMAELPEKLFFPKKITFGLTGLLLATALATVVALLRDRADRTVRETSSLQAAAGLRVLAHIPQVRRVGVRRPPRAAHQPAFGVPGGHPGALRRMHAGGRRAVAHPPGHLLACRRRQDIRDPGPRPFRRGGGQARPGDRVRPAAADDRQDPVHQAGPGCLRVPARQGPAGRDRPFLRHGGIST